nr:oligosaccharide flippase family protein [Variovorax sp. dw_308]
MAGGILQKAIPFVASLYVARTVGQENFATFAFSINTANTITALSALGLAPAILTALGGHRNDADIEDKTTAIFLISAMICVFAAALGMLSARLSLRAISDSRDFAVVAILAPALILLQTTQSTYQGTNRHRAFFLQSCALAMVVAVAFLLASAIRTNSALLGGAYSAAFLLVGAGSATNLLSNMKGSLKNSVSRALSELRPMILSQLPFAGYTGIWMLAIYLCNLRNASKFSINDLAYYNVGFQWYSLMLLVPATLGGVLIPYFVSASGPATVRKQSLQLTLLFAAVSLPLTLCIYLSAPRLLQVYGMTSSPQGIATVRNLILAGALAFALTPALQQFMARRRFGVLLSISVCWSLVALTGTYLFASDSEDVSLSFLFAYCAVALLVLVATIAVNPEQTQNSQ